MKKFIIGLSLLAVFFVPGLVASAFSVVPNTTNYASRLTLQYNWNDCNGHPKSGTVIVSIPATPAGYTTIGWTVSDASSSGAYPFCVSLGFAGIGGSMIDYQQLYVGYLTVGPKGNCYLSFHECIGNRRDPVCETVLGLCLPKTINHGDTVSFSISLNYGSPFGGLLTQQTKAGTCYNMGMLGGSCTITN
jgi:hypothetical protein